MHDGWSGAHACAMLHIYINIFIFLKNKKNMFFFSFSIFIISVGPQYTGYTGILACYFKKNILLYVKIVGNVVIATVKYYVMHKKA